MARNDADNRSSRRYKDKLLVSYAAPESAGHVYVDNLSAGGLRIPMKHPLPGGSPLHLKIFLDFGDEARVAQVSGEVAWSKPGVGMGVRFVNVSEPTKQLLRDAVERLAKRSS